MQTRINVGDWMVGPGGCVLCVDRGRGVVRYWNRDHRLQTDDEAQWVRDDRAAE